ncbi:peptide chain release factor 2 [Francisella tularensis subsp. novicida]|uniref:Peptide chain release factor 2 n=4 Tax=Francisella tularensis TaxID=263 RepID=A0A6I4RV30_FRATU|nr:peptide chain release factor 2 [Francisella tularensis]MBK2036133.1 peptide chain release factor 2 [Francisella tularensis subsp. novicida]MBK2116059.1 peptide chain release factor 2 [Francisella tularensis subsp. novicida]MBK2311784.1 peptide chain release factor 2 [Francisella tularensis subsp. novicida]MBK2315466.1 peptide chain release factor 2 [Francisella tularensis subsp. novicida]MBK2321009.1 peptide chain release factor 2 [Francisella tularensis subsp. novicida]
MESINYKLVLKDLTARIQSLRDYLDYDAKKEKLTEVLMELEDGSIWDNPEYAQNLGKQKVELENVVHNCEYISETLETLSELLELAEEDESLMQEIAKDTQNVASEIEKLEFRRMFSGKMDANNAFLDIQSGSGGTEAQDWAEMLMRMYMRWADGHGFKVSVDNVSDGDVAGIKGCTLKIEGEYAYGWLRTETGIHRLVRKSPFDSNSKRHTSFASVFISPEVDDDIDIEINPADLRVDTYRASGAGGQHVNKTDSAVRITHIPTNIVVQSQSDRSQHKNRDNAMKQLKSKLYEMELQKRNAEKNALEDSKADIGWGSQIRSYVLDQSRVKDLRTGVENTNTQAVLDGDLDKFIEASLKSGL